MKEHVFLETVTPNDTDAAVFAIERLFSQFEDSALPSTDMHVLLKPNLLAKHAPNKGVTTHPDVVRGVVLALHKRGIFNITLVDSPAGPHTASGLLEIYRGCGIEALCKELNVTLYTENENAALSCERGQLVRHFTILKPIAQADYIINLPKLKTHVLTGMSGACKNLFGCVPGLMKAEFHMRFPKRALFGHMLLDLCEGLKPSLHLMDGIIGMEGDGPAGGIARNTGLLLACQNPHLLDLCVCHYMGLSPGNVPTLVAAFERGLCKNKFDTSCLHTNNNVIPPPFENFQLPSSFEGSMDFSGNIPHFLQSTASFFATFTAPHPVVKRIKCIACAKCIKICPAHAINMRHKRASIHQKDCIRCFCCHEICPCKAIDIRQSPLFRM